MTILRSTLALAAAAMLAGGAWAQETPAAPEAGTDAPAQQTPAPEAGTETGADTDAGGGTATDSGVDTPEGEVQGDAISPDGLSLGEAVGEAAGETAGETGDGMGQTYVAETFQDWEMQCVRTPEGSDPCQMYQLLDDDEGNSVAEISMFNLPEGGQAAAGATIVTPLETLLTEAITLQVDSGQARRYPFTFCAAIGCVARVGFTADELAAFRRGARATVSIVPAAAPDQRVNLDLSLMGFSAAYDAVVEASAGVAAE